jgi:hypothetical protein
MQAGATSLWSKQLFWGIRLPDLLAFFGFHLFLGMLYSTTLWLTVSQPQTAGIAVNHLLKILLTAPLWWLFFRRLNHWPFYKKALLHIPCCILYVAVWLGIFYQVADYFELGRLRGVGIWWDVYIPILIYMMQFGIFHAYDYWKETVRQQQKERMLLKLAHTAELNTLKAQIQPHFLFNTLNSISASVPASQEHTRTMIASLADVFRFAMNVSDKEFIPLHKELHFIQNFLSLEQNRFGDRLKTSFAVDEGLADFLVPPMLLQPLIENAVKHGIARSVEGGVVQLSIQMQGSKVHFAVSDTGKGINGTPHEKLFTKGIGLENTRQRLRRLFGEELQVASNQPAGFAVSFSLPFQPQVVRQWN